MRRSLVLIPAVLAAGMLICLGSCTPEQPDRTAQRRTPEPSAVAPKRPPLRIVPAKLTRAVHDRINRERRKQGLPTFRWDAALGRIAGKHSRDMAKRGYFGHTSPEGRGPAQRYLKEHYACGVTIDGVLRNGAEVISRDARDDAGAGGSATQVLSGIAGKALEGWLETEEDRKNILSPHWQREGIGVFVGPDGMVYITVNFC